MGEGGRGGGGGGGGGEGGGGGGGGGGCGCCASGDGNGGVGEESWLGGDGGEGNGGVGGRRGGGSSGGGDGSGGGDDGGGGGDAGALSPTASFSLADCVSSSSRPAGVLNLTTATEDTTPSIVAPSTARLKTSQTGRQPAGGLLCFLLRRRPWNRTRLPRSLASSPPSSEAALSGSGDGSPSGQPMPSSTSSTARLLDEVPRLSLLTPAVLVVSGTSSSFTRRVGRARRARRDRDVCASSSSSARSTRVCLPEAVRSRSTRSNVGMLRVSAPLAGVVSFVVVELSLFEGSSTCPRLARRVVAGRSPAAPCSSVVVELAGTMHVENGILYI